MTKCNWCGCVVDDRKANLDGNHLNFTDCIVALKIQVKMLTQELIDERVLTASLTERLEACETYLVNGPPMDYEEQQRALGKS